MEWRSPVGPLSHEHRLIERMVALMRDRLEAFERSGRADPAFIDAATDFIRSYADRCHHGKEEDILFRGLAAKGLAPDVDRTMRELIAEHVHGRALTRRLVEASARYASGDATALPEIRTTMRELVEFYPAHIEKEDKHFFRDCLPYLSENEQAGMLREYEAFDASLIHEKYAGIVERLEDAGTPPG